MTIRERSSRGALDARHGDGKLRVAASSRLFVSPLATQPGRRREPLWVTIAQGAVVLGTLFSLTVASLSVAGGYRTVVLLATLLAALVWPQVTPFGRAELVICCLVNVVTLIGCVGRRLPAVMGW